MQYIHSSQTDCIQALLVNNNQLPSLHTSIETAVVVASVLETLLKYHILATQMVYCYLNYTDMHTFQ